MARKRRKRIRSAFGGQVLDIYGMRESSVAKFSSGCQLLDCVLGGGWGVNRVANIVGDTQVGKTLLLIEAIATFLMKFPDGEVVYAEAEAAFDDAYAFNLGIPIDRVKRPEVFTIEDVFEDLEGRIYVKSKGKDPKRIIRRNGPHILYGIDSLDALSDRSEQDRRIDQGSYGTKPRQVSEWLRRQNQALSKAKITLMVVSQLRDAIGVTFGEKQKRSGGRALDFYASHCLWLRHQGMIKKTRRKVERVVGVKIQARCKKNKLGRAHRQCTVPLYFEYGIEDVRAGLDFLCETSETETIGLTETQAKNLAAKLDRLSQDEYNRTRVDVSAAVKEVWAKIEKMFNPPRRKYSNI